MQSKAPPRQTEQESRGTRAKRGLESWIRRGLVWLVGGLLALAVMGAIYQAIATQIDQSTYPRPAKWWTWALTACTSTALGEAALR